jgi:DNA-binding CsgD family transcriptional regulator
LNISTEKYKQLLHVAECLSYGLDSVELRAAVGESLLRLLDADFYASYVWSASDRKFTDGVSINMDSDNFAKYDDYYQFHDPITHQLQKRQRATCVNEVIDQNTFIKTEFYNDFLSRDGLYWGINLYAYDGRENIGDIRIWRRKTHQDFDSASRQLLQMIHPHFTNSLRNLKRLEAETPEEATIITPVNNVTASWDAALIERQFGFTKREAEIVREILRGKKDDDIAKELCIAFSTLRTHIKHVFSKADVHSRSSLCHKVLNKLTGFS